MLPLFLFFLTFLPEISWLYFGANENIVLGERVKYAEGPTTRKELRLNPGWDNGVRARIGVECADIELGVYYSYYYNSAHQKWRGSATPSLFSKDGEVGSIVGTEKFTLPASVMSEVEGYSFLKIQEYGIDCFFPFRWNRFCFKPFLGIKGLFIHQTQFSRESIDYINTEVLVSKYTILHTYHTLNGVGLTGGVNVNFWLGGGFSLFCNLDLSLIYGKKGFIHVHDFRVEEDDDASYNEGINTHDFRGVPCFSSALGVLYRIPISRVCGVVKLAWENHLYLQKWGDISTYGLALTAGVEF